MDNAPCHRSDYHQDMNEIFEIKKLNPYSPFRNLAGNLAISSWNSAFKSCLASRMSVYIALQALPAEGTAQNNRCLFDGVQQSNNGAELFKMVQLHPIFCSKVP